MLKHLEEQEIELKGKIDAILNSTFYKSIEKLYQEKQDNLTRKFYAAAKELTRDVAAEKATRKKAKCEKVQTVIKSLWDSVVPEAEKAYFVGWLCSHVDNIYIKVVEGGAGNHDKRGSFYRTPLEPADIAADISTIPFISLDEFT